jgi:hypothetical protein
MRYPRACPFGGQAKSGITLGIGAAGILPRRVRVVRLARPARVRFRSERRAGFPPFACWLDVPPEARPGVVIVAAEVGLNALEA